MQLTDEERKFIAYYRASKENKTQKKSGWLGVAIFIGIILDIIMVAVKLYPTGWGIAVFMVLMGAMSIGNYYIRKPEKLIAERILKED